VTEVVTKFFYSKASEAEILTRARRQYLTSFAGLHFENLPRLTELDAAETANFLYLKRMNSGNRQNSKLFVSKNERNSRNTISL